ncbi:DegV family protein [Anaerolentibacter hominis]|uniref:DegV family protein n=1 Tax=Anaerolentibacter hominis TaxID=3079009 RepID=UPI0031B8A11F
MTGDNYVITCCSTADMPAEYFVAKGIPYACFHYQIDGRDFLDDLGKTVSFPDFYKQIKEGAMPVTSQVNAEEFVEMFEPILQEGKDVLHISLSSGLSGVNNSVEIAKEELEAKYPERRIFYVDTLGASSGYGLIVDTAWEKKQEGMGAEELYTWLEEHKLCLHHWFFSTDLTHYKRGGRISATSAVMGNLLNICPLMNMNYKGELIPRRKIRGKKKVIREIVHMMEEHAENGRDYTGKCFISNSDCYEDARAVADLVEATFPRLNGKVMINSVGTVIGSHTGPGTVALFFWGDKRVD